MPPADNNGSLWEADTRLFESGNFADATIVCGGRTWKVHKAILSSRCKWFRAAFYGNMAEATSGRVVLRDQDPDLVDTMLRYIYDRGKESSSLIRKLDGDNNPPLLCVRLFRLADFFLFDELARHAQHGLNRYLDKTINDHGDKLPDLPQTLANVFEAIRDTYKDNSTEELRQILLVFLWIRKDKHFQIPQIIDLLNEIPALGKDLMKVCLSVDLATDQPRSRELPRPLLVLEAVRPEYGAYTAGGPTRTITNSSGNNKYVNSPCLLRPEQNSGSPFKAVCSTTNFVLEGLSWLSEYPPLVEAMISHEKSSIVGVIGKHPLMSCLIRFASPADAGHYIRCYRNLQPRIEELKESAFNLERDLRTAHDQFTGVAKTGSS